MTILVVLKTYDISILIIPYKHQQRLVVSRVISRFSEELVGVLSIQDLLLL